MSRADLCGSPFFMGKHAKEPLLTAVMSVSACFLADNRMGLMMLGGAWLLQGAAMVFFVKTRKREAPTARGALTK